MTIVTKCVRDFYLCACLVSLYAHQIQPVIINHNGEVIQ